MLSNTVRGFHNFVKVKQFIHTSIFNTLTLRYCLVATTHVRINGVVVIIIHTRVYEYIIVTH